MLNSQIDKIAIWSDIIGIFTRRPHKRIAHVQTSYPTVNTGGVLSSTYGVIFSSSSLTWMCAMSSVLVAPLAVWEIIPHLAFDKKRFIFAVSRLETRSYPHPASTNHMFTFVQIV